jgi:hypothetical protein
MKRVFYSLIVSLVVVSSLVFAAHEIKKETFEKSTSKPLSASEMKVVLKNWAATPDGVAFRKWEVSPEGQKVLAGAAKIRNSKGASANMKAIVTSLALPPAARLGFGVMVSINGEDYILSFGLEETGGEFEPLRKLNVNDKIIVRSHGVSYAPKYSYAIIAGDYVERDGEVIYKRASGKDGC